MLKKHFLKKGVAIFLTVAQVMSLVITDAHAATPIVPSVAPSLSVKDIQIPENLGHIQSIQQFKSAKTLLVIEDAHASSDAQKSISNLLLNLHVRYGSFELLLEGVSETPSLVLEHSFPDKDWLSKKLESDLEKQNIGGGAAALILNKGLTPQPAESKELYEQAVRIYQKALVQQKNILPRLDRAQEIVRRSKKKSYSKKAQIWDALLEQNSLEGLQQVLEDPSLDIKNYSHLQSVRGLVANQSFMKRPVVERFWLHLLQRLEQAAPNSAQRMQCAALKEDFRMKRISLSDSALQIESFGGKNEVESQGDIEKRLYAFALKSAREWRTLKTKGISDEYQQFLVHKLESLFTKSAQQLLLKQTLRIQLLQKLVRMELSWSEWQVVKKMKLKQEDWAVFKDFYSVQFQREQQMQTKIEASFKKSNTVVLNRTFSLIV